MRLLCIDHFFEQDIEAMREAAGANRCWSVPFQVFYEPARRIFAEEVLTGIEAFFKDEYEVDRRRYADVARSEIERLYRTYRFDAVLAPSDTFFWIRAAVRACQDLGIPVVVLQKEATIPPGWLEGPAREWCEVSPFIADHMLVSSDNHRQFWLNGGVDPEIVSVTGQPRFDVYASADARPAWRDLGVGDPDAPTILFLTYDANVYLPIIDRSGMAPWAELRRQTEKVLVELAGSGRAHVMIKNHPQPGEDQSARLAALAAQPGVTVLDPQGDVREYILAADLVVGFQTTALMEALAASRPTIYTWWTEPTRRYEADLIPFHRETEALTVVESPAELRDAIERALDDPAAAPGPAAEALVTRFLGPIDGRAGARCWEQIERIVAASEATPARVRLERSRRFARIPAAVGAAAATAAWSAALWLGPLGYAAYRVLAEVVRRSAPIAPGVFRRELRLRRARSRERLVAAVT